MKKWCCNSKSSRNLLQMKLCLPTEQNLIRNISRSKPQRFDTSVHASLWNAVRLQTRVFRPSKCASEWWNFQFETFTISYSLQVTLIADVIFQFCRHKLLSSLWINTSNVMLSFVKKQVLIAWLKAEIPSGHDAPI